LLTNVFRQLLMVVMLFVLFGLGFLRQVSLCSPGWPQTCDPINSTSKCWDYRHTPPHLALIFLSSLYFVLHL
jgi:hypothetical protein